MRLIRSFFKRITDDLKQKKLIPLKILFFVHASTLFVLYPYLTIHMRELGINVEETAIMSAVTPVVSIVMPPLAGMLADKIGNFRLLLALSSVLGGASALLLLVVPVGRITVTFPPSVELLATCQNSALRLRNMQEYPCSPLHPYAYDVNTTVLSCGFVCELPEEATTQDIDDIVHTHSYDVHLQSGTNTHRLLYRHTVTSHLAHTLQPMKDQSTSRILTNDPYFNTSVSKVSDGEIFFPTPQLYDIGCSLDSTNATCSFGEGDVFSEPIGNKRTMFRARISHDAQKAPKDVRNYWVNALAMANFTKFDEDYDGVDMTTCRDNFFTDNEGEGVRVHTGSWRLSSCSAACTTTVPRKSLCDNKQQQIELDPAFTFWTYLAVRVFIGIIGGTAFAMFEGAVIAILRDQKADYGLQRVYGSLGGMISSPLSGMLIDYASRGKGYTDFRPAFYLYAVLKMASGVLMLSINLEFKQPAQNLLDDVITVFKNIEIVALFIVCFILGTAWGYIESFLFWLLQDLGASRSLMGITITVGGIAGLPLLVLSGPIIRRLGHANVLFIGFVFYAIRLLGEFVYTGCYKIWFLMGITITVGGIAGLPLLVLSGPIIRRLGHANVLFIGFVFYAIRLLGYSLIYNPWLCLIFEALESVTSSLTFTAAVTYAARLSSTTTDTSVQGLLGGVYFGVGKGAGSLIGGYLMKFFGTRPTYQIFSCATFITGCIYFLFNKFYLRHRAMNDDNDICKKRSPADVECHDAAKNDKTDIIKNDISKEVEKIEPPKTKLAVDGADGGSDSGVDNPAYNETETPKKDEAKITG